MIVSLEIPNHKEWQVGVRGVRKIKALPISSGKKKWFIYMASGHKVEIYSQDAVVYHEKKQTISECLFEEARINELR